MDAKDFQLLAALHQNARQSYRSLGRHASLTAPAVRERLKRLQDLGVLHGYGLRIDPGIFGLNESNFCSKASGRARRGKGLGPAGRRVCCMEA